MRATGSNSSRWTRGMLAAIERFRRVAAWPGGPGMRFRLRHSPVHLLRDRLWLLARLQPMLRIHLNISNSFRTAMGVAGLTSTLVMHRSSVFLKQIRTTDPHFSPLRQQPVHAPAVTPAEPRTAHIAEPYTPRRISPAPETNVRQTAPEALPLLATRLTRRSERAESIAGRPNILVRRSTISISPETARMMAGSSHTSPLHPAGHADDMPDWTGRAVAPQQVNVEQLTDQVLRQLDRRLIASRERMGRV